MNTLHWEQHDDGVVVIRLNDENDKVNKLSRAALSDLGEALRAVEHLPTAKGLVLISEKEDNFIVGADLKELAGVTEPGIAEGWIHEVHSLFNRLESLPFPVVAAVHGHCLGGGLELALACHYRIATDHPKTQLGLPEVKLGLLPAGGGTQRLPRMMGVRRALPLMLEGRVVHAHRAKALGMVDQVVYPYNLLEIAKTFALCSPRQGGVGKAYSGPPSADWILRYVPPARKVFFAAARKQVMEKTRGNYPAPLRILECVETGLAEGFTAGEEAEAKAFDDLILSPESRALRQLFFAINETKKHALDQKARPVQRIGILGGGLMGSGIAAMIAQAGIPVFLKDVSQDRLTQGLKSIRQYFDERMKRHHQRPVERDRMYSLVTPTLDYEPFSKVDMVIEAVFESRNVKHRVLREIENVTPPHSVFASNTSALPINSIAWVASRPEAVVGMHYFSPVPRMPLIEVIAGPQTADWVTATAVSVGQKQGKTVIVVNDGPGFYTTRVLSAMLHEAIILLHEWGKIERIDEAMRSFGFPVGPFKLLDEVGMDVAAHIAEELQEPFTCRGFPLPYSIQRLYREGYLGKKNGRSFYRYDSEGWRNRLPLPERLTSKGVNEDIYRFFGGRNRADLDEIEIQERLTLIMVNEAVLCLQEGILLSPRDGDVGAVMGLGFPPFLGGPFRYLEKIGIKEAVSNLEFWRDQCGPRFQPAALLVEMAKDGKTFY